MPVTDHSALLVVGGGPAGLAAAQGYRDAGGPGAVAILTEEARVPYRRPPLTKELLRRRMSASDLPLVSETWFAEHNARLVPGSALALDAEQRSVTLVGGRTLTYDRCVLAPGGAPVRLPVPGADDPAVRTLRTYADLQEIEARLESDTRVIVVGSGFLGCEIASTLRLRGFPVTMVSEERAPQRQRLGPEVAARLADWLRTDGVDLRLEAAVQRIERRGRHLTVLTEREHAPTAELVVMAAGVRPRIELAEAAGLDCREGAIPTDEHMATALPGVWAAGDAARARHAVAGRPLRVEHWGDALAQGEVAGRAAAGQTDACWETPPGFWSTIGDRTVKHAAWGDGFATVTVEGHVGGAFTARYHDEEGELVGVLTHDRDEDYEAGQAALSAAPVAT